jgi:NAD(P)-dependent dehydrogenase (short-subunit alcohol dehydrogenase family)
MKLNGKRVLITGGTSGIGKATVLLMAQEGARIAFTGRDQERGLEIEDIAGENVRFVRADSSKLMDIKISVTTAFNFLHGFDVLVNNAGIHARRKIIEELEDEDLEKLINVNIWSQVSYMREILPHLREQNHGSIVNVNSLNSIRGVYKRPDYTLTKGAILSLTRQVALDYASFNIRVNAIAFGLIMTPFAISDASEISSDELISRTKRIPLGRAGTPEEAARSILFLSSDDSTFITGTVLVVDGGVSASSYV